MTLNICDAVPPKIYKFESRVQLLGPLSVCISTMAEDPIKITVGVLALQGAFSEHLQLLRAAASPSPSNAVPFPHNIQFNFVPVRTQEQLAMTDALIIPGGESTTISLIAERNGLLQPLREFVKLSRKPVWGTCAGMILLSERANRTKRGGQQLIGGLDVCVNRNHFGRQVESFECNLDMPFLDPSSSGRSFRGVFIRAPVIERLLGPTDLGDESAAPDQIEVIEEDTEEVKAPSVEGCRPNDKKVEILAALSPNLSPADTEPSNPLTANPSKALGLDKYGRPLTPGIFGDGFGKDMTGDPRRQSESLLDVGHSILGAVAIDKSKVTGIPGISEDGINEIKEMPRGNIVAVRQGNVVGTSFHPELTGDVRLHRWWLSEVIKQVTEARSSTI